MSLLMPLVSGLLVRGCYGTQLKLNMNRVFQHTGISVAPFIHSTMFECLTVCRAYSKKQMKGALQGSSFQTSVNLGITWKTC